MKFSLGIKLRGLIFFLYVFSDKDESTDPLLRREVGRTLLSLEKPLMTLPNVFLFETPILLL